MPHTLPDLPYSRDALLPHIGAETLSFHHGRHHKAYVETLNGLLAGHVLADVPPCEVIRRIDEVDPTIRRRVLDNAGQHYAHSIYWMSLRPVSPRMPRGKLLQAIEDSFGSLGTLRAEFTKECLSHFGSGWGWLVKDGTRLSVVSTHDGDTPLPSGSVPLLTCDLWEHAYYLDHRNNRADHLKSFWALANWDFAETRFAP